MKTHLLKCWSGSYQALVYGSKTFELRKNDRGFEESDVLRLREWNPYRKKDGTPSKRGKYTGKEMKMLVGWTLYEGFGLPSGFCIMSVFPIEWITTLEKDRKEIKKYQEKIDSKRSKK